MIGIVDVTGAHIYWVETPAQAQDVKEMLDLVGSSYREIH
jgi:hypothetical protein